MAQDLTPLEAEKLKQDQTSVDRDFWQKLRGVARKVPFIDDLVAVYYCAMDPRTPTRVRGVLLAALAYFILPFDLLPDVFAVVGFTDDMAVFAAALRMIQGHITDRHYQAADKALATDGDLKTGSTS